MLIIKLQLCYMFKNFYNKMRKEKTIIDRLKHSNRKMDIGHEEALHRIRPNTREDVQRCSFSEQRNNSISHLLAKSKMNREGIAEINGLIHSSVFSSVQSVTQSCPTLCDPMNRSRPGLPVYHQHPEFTQTHVH